ncbi:Wimple/ift172-like protein [Dinothrombium tinctorium]|uniref:Wimple/ift172-like protein n=1 Tax=Dinothrombium tinctorium TaxID=1965070 RepID=A0A3S3NPP5_9ACAR|nr:Wimple/ift172-like protein [Dinothrombium tinctorium]
MKIKHEKSLLLPENSGPNLYRIECCSWSPNMSKLAVCSSANNQIILFDANTNERKEKFALKPAGKNFSKKSFVVKGIAFSPDSTKLAIGQTDCVIFVYKIGDNWGEKKSIVGKYTLQTPVTCLKWCNVGIVFGCADGKVKVIQTSSNKMSTLLSNNSMVISMDIANDTIVGGYLNGAILMNTFGSRDLSGQQIFTHSCPPFALCLSHTGYVCVGGCDGKLVFSNVSDNNMLRSGSNKQNIEFGSEITCLGASPSGSTILMTSLDKIFLFSLESKMWRQTMQIELDGTCLITCLLWSKDATKLLAGAVNGAVELFSCQWRKKLIGDNHEVNFVGSNQIVIKDLASNSSSVYRSNSEIRDVKIVRDNYVIIWTSNSLITGSLKDPQNRYSEIEWSSLPLDGVKFCFDYENVALITVAGELYVVEIGNNHLLASVRTEFVNPHLMSVRINERKSKAKIFAYLVDLKTISILDLISGLQLCVWSHDERLDWLELNETGKRLLFRDKSLKLHLLDILNQESTTMLNFCGFVQWVPGSDVIVAQSRDKLYIWYDFSKPVIHDISHGSRTEAVGIIREGGLTRVIFNGSENDFILDEVLLEFDTAIEDGDLQRAMSFLETCNMSAESDFMWRTLGNVALKSSNLTIAERAFAAVGDVTRASYIRECLEDPMKLALLDSDWSTFESHDFDNAIETYLTLHKWTKAIDLAARWGRDDVKEDLEKKYFNWLLESNQEADAGELMEKAGNLEEAIKLYLKAGRVVQAAGAILAASSKRDFDLSVSLIESVIRELAASKFYEECGKLNELPMINNITEALNCYIKAKAYNKAIDLARKEFPDEVVRLENQYAEYLLNEARDPAAAVSHFIEAGKTERAVEAAIKGGQFERAAEIAAILDTLSPVYGKQIGDYYASIDQLNTALEIYLSCGCVKEAVTLLNNRGQYNRAYKLAKKLMDPDEAKEMYANIAKSLENEGKLKEAERIYLTCDDADSAISMYKSRKQYDSMIKLVKQFHPDLLISTHLHLAKELESEGLYNQAESHYVAANEWKTAVQMYKNINKWEEAYRVARTFGGAVPAKQVAFLWAKSLDNIDSAVKLLSRFGLLHQVIDYAIESNSFVFARNLVLNSGLDMKHKLNEVNLKYALWLEDEGRFEEAEALFIESGKAKEAVLMYIHNGSFSDALRVAEEHVNDDNCISDILVAQAKSVLEKGGRSIENLTRAEALLLRAGRIELAVKMYKDNDMWDEALRVCEQYAPNLSNSVKREMIATQGNKLNLERSATRTIMHQEPQFEKKELLSKLDEVNPKESLEMAEKAGDREAVIKQALLLSSKYIKEKSTVEALKVLNKYPSVFLIPESCKLLIRIALDLFAFENNFEPSLNVWKALRDSFLQVITSSNGEAESQTVEKLLLITHYMLLRRVLSSLGGQNGANELLIKLSAGMLRYTDVIRVDKAFYEAGKIAKDNNRFDLAFVFWNHFLDIADAIEEGDTNVDHSDFEGTDVPSEVPLPNELFCVENDPKLVEQVKSWILKTSMDNEISQSLPIDAFRDGNVYEASLINSDSSISLPCLVSSYPVIRHKMLELKPGKYAANKDDWNKLLMLTKVSFWERRLERDLAFHWKIVRKRNCR